MADPAPAPQLPDTDAYFEPTADGLSPRAHANAPWGIDMLHGRLLGGLAARAIEVESVPVGWRVARLTVDLFRPAAMAPVSIAVEPVRSGRKVAVVDAHLDCDGHRVGRATAVVLPEGDEPPGAIWEPPRSVWPDPDATPAPPGDPGDGPWKFRVVDGGMGTGEFTRIWTDDTANLVAGETMSPLVRAAVSGDIACPLVNFSDQGLFFINADYTMMLGRYPVGEWIGVESLDRIEADGLAVASARLVDRLGPFAFSSGTSLSRPPMVEPAAQ